MTGRFPFRFGGQTGVLGPGMETFMPATETLLPQKLKALGYARHGAGKVSGRHVVHVLAHPLIRSPR